MILLPHSMFFGDAMFPMWVGNWKDCHRDWHFFASNYDSVGNGRVGINVDSPAA